MITLRPKLTAYLPELSLAVTTQTRPLRAPARASSLAQAPFFAAPPYWHPTTPLRCPRLLRGLRGSRIRLLHPPPPACLVAHPSASEIIVPLLLRPSGNLDSGTSPNFVDHLHAVSLRPAPLLESSWTSLLQQCLSEVQESESIRSAVTEQRTKRSPDASFSTFYTITSVLEPPPPPPLSTSHRRCHPPTTVKLVTSTLCAVRHMVIHCPPNHEHAKDTPPRP